MTFSDRVKYLSKPIWKNKLLLPFNESEFKPQQQLDTEIIYDFESQSNIYSISAFYKQLHKLIIWYKTDNSLQINEDEVKKKAYKINGLTLNTYNKKLNGPVEIEVKELTFDALRQIFERPKRYVVGFNSNFYDLPLASYILASGYHKKTEDPLLGPQAVRKFSNLLIDPIAYLAHGGEEEFGPAIRGNNIDLGNKKRRLSIWDLDKIYGNSKVDNPDKNTAPSLYETFKRLNNTGLHLDMKRLNESDKDLDSRYTSLKRISAQLGYQIEEPESVDLSSNKGLTNEQAVNLLAYNASDVLVTTLIFGTKTYQNVLSTREGLLNRFDESNFKGRLNVNSTSAQFVEKVIAPFDKLKDQETINYFYPIHNDEYQDVQKEIDQDFANKTVPIVDLNDGSVQSVRNKYFEKTLKYKQLNQKYAKLYDQLVLPTDPPDQQFKMKQELQRRFNREVFTLETEFGYTDEFKIYYAKKHNKGYIDRDTLDKQWTEKLQKDPRFAPKTGRDGKIHQRFRVKYGEIQEDLLEHMANTYPKFPDEVYQMYDAFRDVKSEYDYHGNIIKTARQVAVDNYVKRYSKGREEPTNAQKAKGQLGKPIPPKNVYYKFRQGTTDVSGVGVIVQVKDRPMCLSFSVGGVHGEVMNDKAYNRDLHYANKYNATLEAIKTAFPNPKDFYETAINNQLPEKINSLFNMANFKKDYNLFITKHTGGKFTYKKSKKQINPKDYVIPIDMHNAVHVDVDSLYPSLMINLHLFSTWTAEYNDPEKFNETNKSGHWDDVYAKLRAERVKLKKAAEAVPKENWGPVQHQQWAIQLINKLLLNSASGIADGSNETNVRVNNKASSMRIMGQLALTYLVYSVEPDDVYSTSTNTDGVYLTSKKPGFSEKDISDKIEAWKHYFHLGATPEIMSHFVSKDSNNRFEQLNSKEPGTPAGGTIGNAFGASAKKKMTQPFIIDAGIVNYFKTHQNVCTTYDVPLDDLKNYLKRQQSIIINAKEYTDEVRQAMLSFCWPLQPHKHQNYCMTNKNQTTFLQMQHVNRVILTNHGYYLKGYEISKPKASKQFDEKLTNWCMATNQISQTSTDVAYNIKVTGFDPNWKILRLNQELAAYFTSPIWKDLNIDNYAEFTRDRILGKEGSEIWVEPKFKKPTYADKLNELVN